MRSFLMRVESPNRLTALQINLEYNLLVLAGYEAAVEGARNLYVGMGDRGGGADRHE
jgi:hypothetical protein